MQRVGSRAQVMHGNAKMTGGGLKKKDLKYNKQGKIVSKKMSKLAKREKRLQKAGYTTRKGQFGAVRSMKGGIHTPNNKKNNQLIEVDNENNRLKSKISNLLKVDNETNQLVNKITKLLKEEDNLTAKKRMHEYAMETAQAEEPEITRHANIIIEKIKEIFEPKDTQKERKLDNYLTNTQRNINPFLLKKILKKILSDSNLTNELKTLNSKFFGIIQKYIYNDRNDILNAIMKKQKVEIIELQRNNRSRRNNNRSRRSNNTNQNNTNQNNTNIIVSNLLMKTERLVIPNKWDSIKFIFNKNTLNLTVGTKNWMVYDIDPLDHLQSDNRHKPNRFNFIVTEISNMSKRTVIVAVSTNNISIRKLWIKNVKENLMLNACKNKKLPDVMHFVRYILMYKLSIDVSDTDGNTGLMLACKHIRPEIIPDLLIAGMNANKFNKKGDTALIIVMNLKSTDKQTNQNIDKIKNILYEYHTSQDISKF